MSLLPSTVFLLSPVLSSSAVCLAGCADDHAEAGAEAENGLQWERLAMV